MQNDDEDNGVKFTDQILADWDTEEHHIDPAKIVTLEDVVAILTVLQFTIFDDGSERFAPIRHLYRDKKR